MERKRKHKSTIRSQVLTLRLTNEEMLRFKVAALSLGKKRARIVRERVADLIGGTLPVTEVSRQQQDCGQRLACGLPHGIFGCKD